MKKFVKSLTALVLSAAMLTIPAGAVTQDGESETWFDSIWALIDAFGLKAENDPYVLQNYINKYLEKHPDQLYEVLNDILTLLDTHSMYMSSEEYSEGFSTLAGFVGVGVKLQQEDSGIVIVEVVPDSSAEEAGLQAGDLILTVDGVDATKWTTAEMAAKLRGEENTNVTLTIRRQGRDISFTCTRRHVTEVYVTNKTIADGVEYIKISAIGSNKDWEAFSKIWSSLPGKNTRAVVLDLRGNGGGLISAALQMINAMVPDEGKYLAGIRYREDMGGLERHESTGGGLPLNKVIVLVDSGTASAAELIAGSLRDVGVATLLGETTYGKGQGQYHIPLINGDKLVITSLEMELPRTGVYEGIGLKPDIILNNQKVTVNKASLTPLNTGTTLYFGQESDDVYAMNERLALLGLLQQPGRVFDGTVLDAVQSFLQGYDMELAQYASPEMLSALDKAIETLDGSTYMLDLQLQTAVGICEIAAKQPQQYTVQPDGSWTRN